MLIKFHRRGNGKRRGGILPARLRFAARRGVTLVELMIAMLILTLVCIAWLEIIGIQSARKEARRREAVERLAGMMDAFMYKNRGSTPAPGSYRMVLSTNNSISFTKTTLAERMFDVGESAIGYQLRVVDSDSLLVKGMKNWDSSRRWLVGLLYNETGEVNENGEVRVGGTLIKPFFKLSIYL